LATGTQDGILDIILPHIPYMSLITSRTVCWTEMGRSIGCREHPARCGVMVTKPWNCDA